MKFLITRTSDGDYANAEIKDFPSIESLIDFKNNVGEIIIKENYWYQEGDMFYFKRNYPYLNAEEIATIPYEIEIYDTYRE
jgi:hypothetical protein